MIFVGHPYVQLIPCIALSLVIIMSLLWVRPYHRKLNTVLDLAVEMCLLAIFSLFLSVKLSSDEQENEERRKLIGRTIIGLLIVMIARCVIDLILGLIEMAKAIKKHCSKQKTDASNKAALVATPTESFK